MTAQRGDFDRPPGPRFRDQLAAPVPCTRTDRHDEYGCTSPVPDTDNQQRARDLLTAPHPGTDINPYWRIDMLAGALDAAEARGAAEVEARVQAAAAERCRVVMDRCNAARRREAQAGRPDTAAAYDDAGEWLRRALARPAPPETTT